MSGHGDEGTSSESSAVTQDQDNRAKPGTWADAWKIISAEGYKSEWYEDEEEEDGGTRMADLPEDHPWTVFRKVSVIARGENQTEGPKRPADV
jgi:hypothetical protein